MGNTLSDIAFSQQYISGKRIANGTYGTVKKCKRISDNKIFAVKIVKKNELNKRQLLLLKDEINILKTLTDTNEPHPNIINLENVFEDDKKVKIVLELCQKKTLLDKIYEAPNKRMDESQCAEITYSIAKTLKYLHSNNIVHRDLKPQNILFTEDGVLKIIDFGSAKYEKEEEGEETEIIFKMKTKIGTPCFVAPEMISNRNNYYDNKVDLWSLGVILYLMLSKEYPFSSQKGMKRLFKSIINGQYSFSSPIWNNISDDAIDLIKRLLSIDVNQRISCDEVLKHQWILKHIINQ